MMKSSIVGACAAALFGTVAHAGAIQEVEPNDTLATAQFIAPANYPANAFAFDGFLTPGDVDYITFTLPDAVALTSLTVSVPPNFQSVDTRIGVFNSVGALIAADDNSGPGDFSFVEAQLTPGTYYIGITGGPDVDFLGAHTEDGGYKLIVAFNIIPAPGAMALLGIACFVGRRRRRC